VLPDRSQQLCSICLAELPYTHFEAIEMNPVERTFYGRAKLIAATSLLYFTPSSLTQELVHQFKYNGQQNLARFLGRIMGRSILSSPRFSGIQQILPLPLYKNREKQRGYNQSQLLSEGISDILGLPILSDAVIRQKATKTQTHKSREERWANVGGQFSLATHHKLANKSVLLVDDVITTGATLDACASLINTVSNTNVYIASLAFAMK
jgi:ComF family protein